MTQEGFKRKLTAILSADVVGYSRLMEDNEEATIQTLNTYRNSMSTLIQQHRGRVVDMTGDNLMAEFSSVVEAVKCAVETQKDMRERNAGLPENRRMLFRIGVNLGDIVEEEDRIYGDGVNIAARLEGSVQRAGDRVRITAQLIDAAGGNNLWADRYDRDFRDLFALQDEITLKIVFALQVKLSVGVQTRLTRKTMPNFEAWSYYVRGYGHMMRHTKADNAKARDLFERAAGLAPEYVPVFIGLGWTYWEDAFHGWRESREESLPRAVEFAKKTLALEIRPHDPCPVGSYLPAAKAV